MTDITLKLRAYSPGKFPILVVQTPDDELRLLYYETDYDPEVFKPAKEDWLRDNAIGRHSFIEVETPKDLDASELKEYVESEILNS
ncbi:MAG: hypothetical protein M3475_03075 [Actinomycetota bacterium]|nr:hypothetical protein [Actinomycetota bacterium]